MMACSLSHRRVIIVGAGHSGLATAAALRSSGLEPQKDFVIIDSAPPVDEAGPHGGSR
ncbi:NAD(P)-binding protein [Microbacterium sp. NPDC078849]|uniref:NAD(P)-binding protein n=2 Tax=unclassified Microbacterium TaxID=2609290 RepID=UPI00344BE9C4